MGTAISMSIRLLILLLVATPSRVDEGDQKEAISWGYVVTQKNDTERPSLLIVGTQFDAGLCRCRDQSRSFSSKDKLIRCGWPFQSAYYSWCGDYKEIRVSIWLGQKFGVVGNSPSGHVSTDGPKEKGGLRYCINSLSILIPRNERKGAGYY